MGVPKDVPAPGVCLNFPAEGVLCLGSMWGPQSMPEVLGSEHPVECQPRQGVGTGRSIARLLRPCGTMWRVLSWIQLQLAIAVTHSLYPFLGLSPSMAPFARPLLMLTHPALAAKFLS